MRNVKTAIDKAVLSLGKTRPGHKKIVILLIASKQDEFEQTYNASMQDVTNAGGQLFVVFINEKPPRFGQDHNKNVFKVGSFDMLYPRSYPIAREIVKAPGKN